VSRGGTVRVLPEVVAAGLGVVPAVLPEPRTVNGALRDVVPGVAAVVVSLPGSGVPLARDGTVRSMLALPGAASGREVVGRSTGRTVVEAGVAGSTADGAVCGRSTEL
jgi:hypothetical protein